MARSPVIGTRTDWSTSPQGVIAVAIGSALLPTISNAIAQHDLGQFRDDLHRALRLAAVILIPVALCLVPYAVPVTSLLFRHGAYSWEDVLWTAWTLQALTPFLLAVAGINIVKKAFFAIDDRNTLLVVGLAGVALTALIGWSLVESLNVRGLAFALSISTCIQLVAYLLLLPRRLEAELQYTKLAGPFSKIALASLPPFVLLTIISRFGQWEHGPADMMNWVVFVGGAVAAVAAYLGGARALNIEELSAVLNKLRRRSSP